LRFCMRLGSAPSLISAVPVRFEILPCQLHLDRFDFVLVLTRSTINHAATRTCGSAAWSGVIASNTSATSIPRMSLANSGPPSNLGPVDYWIATLQLPPEIPPSQPMPNNVVRLTYQHPYSVLRSWRFRRHLDFPVLSRTSFVALFAFSDYRPAFLNPRRSSPPRPRIFGQRQLASMRASWRSKSARGASENPF